MADTNWADFTPADAVDRPGVPELVAALTNVESGGRADALSPQGARGSMQIMPATFRQYAKPGESYDNDDHRRAAAIRKVEDDYDHYDGDPAKVAAAYIGGRGAVRADGSIRDDVADALGTTPAAYAERVVGQLKPAVNWDDFKPVASGPVNWADFTPVDGGAGRGTINPPAADPNKPNLLASQVIDGPADESDPLTRVSSSTPQTGASTFTATAIPDAGGGRGFMNPGMPADPNQVGAAESLGRGYGKAGASMAKTANLAAVAPVVVFNAITRATDTPVQDALFRNLVDPTQSAVDWYSLKPEEKQSFMAKVSEGIGALASDLPLMIASGGTAAETKLAQSFPTMAEHIGNVTSKGFDAMRPLMVKAGVEKAQQVLDNGGTAQEAITSATTAALLTGFTGSQPMSAEGPALARVLTGIPVGAATSEGHRVIQNAADPANMQQPFTAEGMAVGAVTNSAIAGVMGHPSPRMPARADLGYEPVSARPDEAADPVTKIMGAGSVDEAIAAAQEVASAPAVNPSAHRTLEQEIADLRQQPAEAGDLRSIRPLENPDVRMPLAADDALQPGAGERGADTAGSVDAGGLLDRSASGDTRLPGEPVARSGADDVLGDGGGERAAVDSKAATIAALPQAVDSVGENRTALENGPVESLGKTGGNGPAGGKTARSQAYDANPFRAFLGQHGVSMDLRSEFAPGVKEQRAAMVQGYGPIFRRTGQQIDSLARLAHEDGFLPSADPAKLYDLIGRTLSGERIAPLYGEGQAEKEMQARIDRQHALEEDTGSHVAALPDAQLFHLHDADIPWERIASNVSEAEAMRSLGFSEQEIHDASTHFVANESRRAAEAGQSHRSSEQAAPGEAPSRAAGRDEQARADSEGLTRPTREDILAQQDRAKQGNDALERRQREADVRAKADADLPDFALKGSDRAADSNPDQIPAFSRDSRENQRPLIELRQRKSVLESLLNCLG